MLKQNENLKPRDIYLGQLIAFQDTESVKVVTGIRRCGKSSLLKLMQRHLINSGIRKEQIIAMNFESMKRRLQNHERHASAGDRSQLRSGNLSAG